MKFQDRALLVDHITDQHCQQVGAERRSALEIHRCKLCPGQVSHRFGDLLMLEEHIQMHHDQHYCKNCGVAISGSLKYREHLRNHHPLTERTTNVSSAENNGGERGNGGGSPSVSMGRRRSGVRNIMSSSSSSSSSNKAPNNDDRSLAVPMKESILSLRPLKPHSTTPVSRLGLFPLPAPPPPQFFPPNSLLTDPKCSTSREKKDFQTSSSSSQATEDEFNPPPLKIRGWSLNCSFGGRLLLSQNVTILRCRFRTVIKVCKGCYRSPSYARGHEFARERAGARFEHGWKTKKYLG